MKHHWSEAYKDKSLWYVNKINSETGKVIQKQEFASAILANGFLNQINIYIDGERVYSGV